MKSLMLLWREVANELAARCGTSTSRDFNTVVARSKHEGILPFLAVTLPTFGKDFERSLDQGTVNLTAFPSFKKSGRLPAFLQGFVSLVFDRKTGLLLDDPDIEAIFAVRQLTLMFAKVLVPLSEEKVQHAMFEFVKCESEVVKADQRLKDSEFLEDFVIAFNLLFRDTLAQLDSDVYYGRLTPMHGPGSTADRLTGNGKFDNRSWTQRLEDVFPFGDNALPSWRSYYALDHVNFTEPDAEIPVRVIAVPKTQKTPRIIAIEPTCMQYMQQAIRERLYELLETDSNPVSKMIGFSDQTPNQRMAEFASLTGELATLDLSEASDRVSWQLVSACLRYFPNLLEAVDATRSRRADVLGYGVVPLAKFASMGSALTFPIEAMVFLTSVYVGIRSGLSNQPSHSAVLRSMEGRVRVYGDDIVVPTHNVPAVVSVLTHLGFKVNSGKSFWTGYFRESCGKEYYGGHDVSITRVRRVFPVQRDDVSEVVSLVSLRNQFYFAGLWRSAAYLDEIVGKLLPYYPTVHPESPVLGRHTLLDYQVDKTHADLHSPLVRGYVKSDKPPPSLVSGEGALLKFFLKRGSDPFNDERHLERQGRSVHVRIKKRWAQPF